MSYLKGGWQRPEQALGSRQDRPAAAAGYVNKYVTSLLSSTLLWTFRQ